MTKLILILIVSILFDYSYSYEIEKLNELKSLKFEKDKYTTGDKNGNNKFNQLICYGDMDLCNRQEIILIICNNLNYNKTDSEPNWNCLTKLKDDIAFNKTSINCEYNDKSNSNEIIQGSCYFHYQLKNKSPNDCLMPIALTFNFTFVGTVILYLSIYCCLRKRLAYLANKSIPNSEINLAENLAEKKSRW